MSVCVFNSLYRVLCMFINDKPTGSYDGSV